jgi:hypothetical protein
MRIAASTTVTILARSVLRRLGCSPSDGFRLFCSAMFNITASDRAVKIRFRRVGLHNSIFLNLFSSQSKALLAGNNLFDRQARIIRKTDSTIF